MNVIKRSGEIVSYDVDKINKVVEYATEGISNVSSLDIILKANFNLYEKIRTEDIHHILIDAAVSLITPESPNYQYVAANLLNYHLRKTVWGSHIPPRFFTYVNERIASGVYDDDILNHYSVNDFDDVEKLIDHSRDSIFTYAGLRQMCDKYLLKDRVTNNIHETPQFAYMLIAMICFRNYDSKTRLSYIKRAYDAFSLHKINLPTPQVAGVRTKLRQYSSCLLTDVDDSMDSIAANWQIVGKSTAARFGIGINFGRIRGIGTPIRNGEVVHTGVIPFLKSYESIVKSCHQNGIRGGGATVNFPIFHTEILDILPLKNNGGTEDNRVRKLDYTISISKLFYSRFMANENITLFSPHDVPDLYNAYGTSKFDSLYLKYEKTKSIPKKSVSAIELFTLLLKERIETGRIYILNIDHANTYGSWNPDLAPVKMSNLCVIGDTRLATSKGLVKARDLYYLAEELIVSYDGRVEDIQDTSVKTTTSTQMYCTGNNQPVFKVSTDKGYSITATKNHGLFIKGSKKLNRVEVKDLVIGDKLAIQSSKGQFGTEGSYELGLLIGLVTGDGTFSKSLNRPSKGNAIIRLYNNDMELASEVYRCKNHVLGENKTYKKPSVTRVSDNNSFMTIASSKLYDHFCSLGTGKEMKQSVPEVIFRGTEDCVKGYLQGLFTSDACVSVTKDTVQVQLTSINESLLKDVQLLLSNFGLVSSINSLSDRTNKFTYVNKNGEVRDYISKSSYRLDITGHYAKKFGKLIGFLGNKQLKLDNAPQVKEYFTYATITNIEYIGNTDVYDVTQPLNNSVIFNGIVSSQCVEVTQPTIPITSADDPNGEIGTCVLSAVNLVTASSEKDIEDTCDIIVRMLESIIDYQEYKFPAMENFTLKRRSLGVGITNLAMYLAMNGYKYTDPDTPNKIDEIMEMVQFYLLKASNSLAKTLGPCEKFNETKYYQGILPIDNYKKDVDAFITRTPSMDWESLREDIKKYGLRHSTLTACMPCESSSVIQNSSNGIEPVREILSFKKSKSGSLPVLMPNHNKWKYQLAYDIDNTSLIKVSAAIQKWIDMAISTNLYYRYSDYPEGKLPNTVVAQDLLMSYKYGLKSLYYANTDDSTDVTDKAPELDVDCESGACSI